MMDIQEIQLPLKWQQWLETIEPLLKLMHEGVICLDLDYKIIKYNRAIEEHYGWQKYKPQGGNFLEICPDEEFIQQLKTVLPNPPLLTSVVCIEQKSANVTWQIHPIFYQEETLGIFLFGIQRIDSVVLLEEKVKNLESYIQTFLDIIPGSVYWKNKDGVYLECNDEVLRKGSFSSKAEVLGKTDEELWPDSAKKIKEHDLFVINQDKKIEVEEVVQIHTGETLYFTGVKAPVRNSEGNIVGLIGNSLDITELKVAKELAESANRAKLEFISTASHELRLPLAAILGMCDFLQEDLSEEQRKEYLDQLIQSTKYLYTLFNHLLDFSKLESKSLKLAPTSVDFKKLIEEILGMLMASAQKKNLELLMSYPENFHHNIIMDENALRQILINLLGNAIKFTASGYVKIVVEGVEKNDKTVDLTISIIDTGIGIPKEKQSMIFECFEQVDASFTRQFSGTGLGLYITKKLLGLMNGSITVSSELRKGSTFTCLMNCEIDTAIGLSFSDGHAQRRSKFIKEAVSLGIPPDLGQPNSDFSGKYKALLIEDNKIIQKIHKKYLEQLKYSVTLASTGVEALDYMRTDVFDLILMDIGLPDLNGFEVTMVHRTREKINAKRPAFIIGLTAYSSEEIKHRCFEVGMDDVWVKPIRIEDMEERLLVRKMECEEN